MCLANEAPAARSRMDPVVREPPTGGSTILTQVRFEWLTTTAAQPGSSPRVLRGASGDRGPDQGPSSRNGRAAARFVLQLAELASGTEKRPIDQGHGAGANSWLTARRSGAGGQSRGLGNATIEKNRVAHDRSSGACGG